MKKNNLVDAADWFIFYLSMQVGNVVILVMQKHKGVPFVLTIGPGNIVIQQVIVDYIMVTIPISIILYLIGRRLRKKHLFLRET